MSTLWKRANGAQYRMLKIISGAVLDAANAHPHKLPDRKFARGVAKRAVGTLTAQWADVLAADTWVDPSSGKRRDKACSRRSHRLPVQSDGEGRPQTTKAAPFSKMCARLGKMVKPLRMAGDIESAEAVKAAIRTLAPLVRRERPFPLERE